MSKKKKNDDADIIDLEVNGNTASEAKKGAVNVIKQKLSTRLGMGILLTVMVVLIVTLIVVTIIHLSTSKGERTAENMSEYIGKSVSRLEKDMDISLKEKSDFSGVNKAVKFDKVYESEEKLKADGITYPTWAIFIKVDNNTGDILSVKYTDFTVIEKSLWGTELKNEISLDRFGKKSTFNDINSEIGTEFYSQTYTDSNIVYVYKYWYTTESGDRQAVILECTFNKKGKFREYKSTPISPENM